MVTRVRDGWNSQQRSLEQPKGVEIETSFKEDSIEMQNSQFGSNVHLVKVQRGESVKDPRRKALAPLTSKNNGKTLSRKKDSLNLMADYSVALSRVPLLR